MSSKRKVPERPLGAKDNADDAFVAGVLQASTWAQRNQQKLVVGGLFLLVAVLGGLYYLNFRSTRTNQAAQELEQVQQTLGVGDPAAARAQLVTYIERFDGTPYAIEARVILGELDLQSGEAAQAISALEPLRSAASNPVALQGVRLLAAAYETANRPEDAIDAYMEVADKAEMTFQSREAALAAARVMTQAGLFERAAGVYEELLLEFEPGDPARGALELRLAELTAR